MLLRAEFEAVQAECQEWRLRFLIAPSAQLRVNFSVAPKRGPNGTVAATEVAANHLSPITDYWSLLLSLLHRRPIHEREDVPPFCVVAERVEVADLIEATRTVKRVQIMGVAGC